MISSSTQAFQAEAAQSDAFGLPLPTKKKKNAPLSTLFSSLVEKAKTPKDAKSDPRAAEALPQSKTETGAAKLLSPDRPLSHKKNSGEILAELDPRLRAKQQEGAKGRAAEAKTDTFQRESPASALPSAFAVAKPTALKDAKEEDALSAAGESKTASKKNVLDSLKKDKVRDPGEAVGAEVISAAAAGVVPAARNLKKDDAAGKTEEKAEAVDGKKKEKRKDRLEIEVFDQRKGEGFGASAPNAAKGASADGAVTENGSKANADLVLTLRDGAGDRSERSDSSNSASGSKTSFADALARELREAYNGDIVKRASVVLKDGGEGMVRLALQPEALGSVKIKLEVADNKIAGRILVETEDALKAFGKELRSLEQAFVDGGFDGASLELALSSGGADSGGGRGNDSSSPRPFFSDRLAASEYDSAVPSVDSPSRGAFAVREDSLVDMLA